MPERDETFRTFTAIQLCSNIRARVGQHIDQLRREFPDVRASWLREENLHLTLKFFGDVRVMDIAKLSAGTEHGAKTVNSFELIVSGCGAFPPHGPPKVLWIGTLTQPPVADWQGTHVSSLKILYDALEDEYARAGFAREERPFHPHLTIARLRSRKGAHRLSNAHKELGFDSQKFVVSELIVFRSELSSEGSKHIEISRHELRGGPT